MKNKYILILVLIITQSNKVWSQKSMSGNPLFSGWYADPEAVIFKNEYWIYPTYSARYEEQVFVDAFSSIDLVKWKKHAKVLDTANVKWAKRAMWAPASVEKDGKYYLFFASNYIQSDNEYGGIGVAIADKPQGPFKDFLGKPLIDKFYNKAQPIDQFVLKTSMDLITFSMVDGSIVILPS